VFEFFSLYGPPFHVLGLLGVQASASDLSVPFPFQIVTSSQRFRSPSSRLTQV
jgi:hypothetical protein